MATPYRILPESLDATDLDFDSVRERLFAMIRSAFPEWTDENVANFGTVLLELNAHCVDVLAHYLDNHARESRIATASQRRSLLALAKLVAYAPPGASAATGVVTLSIPAAVAGSVILPAGTKVSTADVAGAVDFQLLSDAIISAGSTSTTVTAEHSAAAADTFTAGNIANQEVVLSATPFLDGSAEVGAANGAYSQVASFVNSTAADLHFVVVVDQNDRARIRFGNGVNGAIPSGTISVAYKTGGGSEGNVPAAAIRRIDGAFVDSFGTPVAVSITNLEKTSGGLDRVSNAAIRVLAPESLRAPVNSVSREDFVINARRIPAVARALMLTKDEDPGTPENTGFLYIVPQGGGTASPELQAQVLTMVTTTYPAPLTFKVNVLSALYASVDVYAAVHKRAGYSKATVKANLLASLAAFFAVTNADGSENSNVDFGANVLDADGASEPMVAWSDVFNAIRDTEGVRRIDPNGGVLLDGVRADVVVAFNEFPILGTVTIVDADDGATL